MKIVILSDDLFLPTGLAKVGRELALGLMARGHEIGYIGLHHRNDTILNIPQGMMYWFTNNTQNGADILDGVIIKYRPDVLLTIGDMWNFAYITNPEICRTRRLFQWCAYLAVDGEPINGGIPPALVPIIEDVDIPVAYTDYAKEAILKSCKDPETALRIKTIYHGVDTNFYKPLPWSERKKIREAWGIDDKFMFLCVARNQSRKNIPETFRAWKKFSGLPETKDKVIFWPHMYFHDPAGWNIEDFIKVLQLNNRSVMYFNQVAYAHSEFHLIPESEVAKLYQVADAFILISGEGFGLPTFEAMATKLPCILLDYAASSELGAEGRAELVPVTGEMTWTGIHLTQRPLPDPEKICDSMLRVYRDKSSRDAMVKKSYEFASQYTWNRVLDDWHSLFLSHEIPFLKPFELEVVA